jgi:hypothetical protein
VIVVTVPAQGCAMSHFAVPAMSEQQADIARRNGFGLIDMSRGLGGLMGDVPTTWTYCPNRKAVGKWIHSTDDAHANTGPSMAKYYGLIARQLLEPSKWYELNLTCSAVDDPAWIGVSLGDTKATTDDRGRFRFERLTGNLVDMPLSIAPLP